MMCLQSSTSAFLPNETRKDNEHLLTKLSEQIELPAGSDYYVKYNSTTSTLESQERTPASEGLSEAVVTAIAKAPSWIQRPLIHQFHALEHPKDYAELLLNVSKQYVDEIAFSIAASPLGSAPSPQLLKENAEVLYKNDEYLEYAEILDCQNSSRDFFSTVRYQVLEDGIEKQYEFPQEIYYWYLVHPDLSRDDADYLYDHFWREYLFYHNDLGYPLLQEKIADIQYLWDGQAYSQPGNRLWTWSMDNHPTAIEVASYWIGKTVPAQAVGDRPIQPNIIAHEHNGWCGELQRLAVAALRTLLIPALGACNVGEDHVWREFYERGWHQNDNWWTDSGGAVDIFEVYGYQWGKNMSAIYAWEGDGSIFDLTSHYIHDEDRVTVAFSAHDIFLQPLDGARVTAVVKGIKDITWIKNSFLERIDALCEKLPDILKGRIFLYLSEKLHQRIDEFPDVIDGPTITIWNYTNMDGICTFELGKNCEYLFIIQHKNLKKPWQLARGNRLRLLKNARDKTFHVFFLDASQRPQRYTTKEINEGACHFSLEFNTTASQFQSNVNNDALGSYSSEGLVDFFLVDEENFRKYTEGKLFDCYNYQQTESASLDFYLPESDWYFVIQNNAHITTQLLDITLEMRRSEKRDAVDIVCPTTSLFENPIYNTGEECIISGIATDEVTLLINGEEVIDLQPVDNQWTYTWDTTHVLPNIYTITALCGEKEDSLLVTLIDVEPPVLSIETPLEEEIIEEEILLVTGTSSDFTAVADIAVSLDNGPFLPANGTEEWFLELDISDLEIGEHTLTVRAIDLFESCTYQQRQFILNESGHTWGPEFHAVFHTPDEPTNTSNIIVYTNVTSTSPFEIQQVLLMFEYESTSRSSTMYRYGRSPVQERHVEDPLYNQSNAPLYGKELGEFDTGTVITYSIIAIDTAHNSIHSSPYTILVQ